MNGPTKNESRSLCALCKAHLKAYKTSAEVTSLPNINKILSALKKKHEKYKDL